MSHVSMQKNLCGEEHLSLEASIKLSIQSIETAGSAFGLWANEIYGVAPGASYDPTLSLIHPGEDLPDDEQPTLGMEALVLSDDTEKRVVVVPNGYKNIPSVCSENSTGVREEEVL